MTDAQRMAAARRVSQRLERALAKAKALDPQAYTAVMLLIEAGRL